MNVILLLLKGCVKVWDIRDLGCKSPVSQLDCLVSDRWWHAITAHKPFLQTMIVAWTFYTCAVTFFVTNKQFIHTTW